MHTGTSVHGEMNSMQYKAILMMKDDGDGDDDGE